MSALSPMKRDATRWLSHPTDAAAKSALNSGLAQSGLEREQSIVALYHEFKRRDWLVSRQNDLAGLDATDEQLEWCGDPAEKAIRMEPVTAEDFAAFVLIAHETGTHDFAARLLIEHARRLVSQSPEARA